MSYGWTKGMQSVLSAFSESRSVNARPFHAETELRWQENMTSLYKISNVLYTSAVRSGSERVGVVFCTRLTSSTANMTRKQSSGPDTFTLHTSLRGWSPRVLGL